MSKSDVARAWKDPKYRHTLSAAEQAALPANPAGVIDVADEQFGQMSGGRFIPTAHTCDCGTYKIFC